MPVPNNKRDTIIPDVGDIWEYTYHTAGGRTITLHMLVLKMLNSEMGTCSVMFLEEGNVLTVRMQESDHIRYKKVA